MAKLIIIVIALIMLAIYIFSKQKKERILGLIGFCCSFVALIVIRFREAGTAFVHQSFVPFLGLVISLVISYFILEYLDKKYGTDEDDNESNEKNEEGDN